MKKLPLAFSPTPSTPLLWFGSILFGTTGKNPPLCQPPFSAAWNQEITTLPREDKWSKLGVLNGAEPSHLRQNPTVNLLWTYSGRAICKCIFLTEQRSPVIRSPEIPPLLLLCFFQVLFTPFLPAGHLSKGSLC
jgi:hypothetical protein